MESLSFISLGGVGDVTKNMYLYTLGNPILIIDCGIGFVDETIPGVDLVIPDVTFLINEIKNGKKIVAMLLTHGHEDHIGALPFILPQLPQFPIYATTLTAALANEKLKDFGLGSRIQTLKFSDTLNLGPFTIQLTRVTHSVIDAANYFVKTPVGNFYHGSDFKFDFTPVDGKPSELRKIAKWGEEGVLSLFSDCLGAERPGHTPSELKIAESFDEEFRRAKGKIFVTTYSSNISRMNQAIEVALKHGRKVCFIGRSFLKARDIGRKLSYMSLPQSAEVRPQDVKRLKPSQVMILVAGSQAQADSGLMRIASDNDQDLRINSGDSVIFSADPIPGNENNINRLIDLLSKKEARVVYSEITDEFHVSGHGSEMDLKLMISLTNPKFLLPIGGTFRQMVAYRELARSMGYTDDKIILLERVQEVLFSQHGFRMGRKIEAAQVYVDQLTGEEVEKYVIMDRKKISEEGVVIIVVEVDSETGQLVSKPEVVTKGLVYPNKEKFVSKLELELQKIFNKRPQNHTNVMFYRKLIQQKAEDILWRDKREPLVVPVVLEV